MRKRILCAQMTDCAKVIEINGLKMAQFTSSSNWRHPHLLQRNIPGIQDTVYIIEAALDELLEFTQRISMNRGDPKQDGRELELQASKIDQLIFQNLFKWLLLFELLKP